MTLPPRDGAPWLDPAAVPHIQIRGLTKRFGSLAAVAEVDLDIYRGELFALLGGSGCGKTTLLRMLAGFVAPDAGSVRIEGADMLPLPPYERPVNMMFQSYALFPHMTVEDNVAFGLRRDGVEKEEITRRVAEVLKLVQMEAFAGRKPDRLSGGQRQRVALARSIVKRPKVLLLDEPLSALDKKLREATRFELVEIQKQVGITFVVVTHDQEEALSLATRIAVMDQGRIIQVGRPSEIYEHPTSRFVADFIGSVNLFDGRFKAPGVIDCPETGGDLLAEAAADQVAGAAACLAVRPERIRLAKPGESLGDGNRLAGQIHDAAYMGDGCVYQVALPGGKLLKVAVAATHDHRVEPFRAGEAVQLGWAPGAGILVKP
jgi:putrescine transport system ATP-binding protein